MNNCPNEEDMACFIDGLLSVAEVRQIEKHLLKCNRCREIVKVTRSIKEKCFNDANEVV